MNMIGICSEKGKYVNEKYLFYYAIYRIFTGNEKERKEFTDWFYSGNWICDKNLTEENK